MYKKLKYEKITLMNNPPAGFNVSWNVSPSNYFNTPTSGINTSVTLYPKAQYAGECTLTYTLSDNIGSVQYSKKFFINAPNRNRCQLMWFNLMDILQF